MPIIILYIFLIYYIFKKAVIKKYLFLTDSFFSKNEKTKKIKNYIL